ncbi:MAG: type II secretion system secretin GspD [Gammaproteobacteria bacterium]
MSVALITVLLVQNPAWAESITLNLKEADIRALIGTVSKFTGKNFVVDPRVKSKVTVVSSKTMSADELYEVFLSILQVHGYAAVPVGNIIKIVPEVNAKQGPLPVSKNNRHKGDTLITRVITLDHIPAAQLVPILRPLIPQQGHMAAYNPTNTLIITDHAANIKRLTDIIRSIDKPESDELEIIPLKHASATELVRILNSLHAKGGAAKTAPTDSVKLAADERTNSILMSGERAIRLKIRATIAHLDTPLGDDGGNTHVIYLKYAKAEDMVKILTGVQKTQASSVGKAGAKAASSSASTTSSDIQADETTNALIITASPDVVLRMKSIIRQLDIRRAQVLVEAIIAEISNDKTKELGTQIVVAGSDEGTSPVALSNLGGPSRGILNVLQGDLSSLSSAGFTIGAGKDSGTRFAILLSALGSDAATNILSTPSIVTLDNQEAEIVVGQNVPFLTGQFTNSGSDGTNPFQTIERQDVGITLKVTPQINEGSTIKLDIEQEVSNIAASSTSSSDVITNKRTIKTSVLVEDGEILVLGGLIDDAMRDTESKVPLLGDIPLLGHLFRYRSTSKLKQNLMIFMRPSIMRDNAAAMYHTHEKYNYLRAQQIHADDQGFGLLKDENTPLLPSINNVTPAKVKPQSKLEIKQPDKEEPYKRHFDPWGDEVDDTL